MVSCHFPFYSVIKMNSDKLKPKILNILYNLKHDRYLQKTHTILNFFTGLWLAFLGGIATYVIEGQQHLTSNLILFTFFGTSVLFSIAYNLYIGSFKKRLETIKQIVDLNKYSKEI